MVNNKTSQCQALFGNETTSVLPETIVLSSQPGTWSGIEVVQRRHTVSANDFPPLSCHTIGVNLGHPLSAVERIDGRVYEGYMSQGHINVLPAGLPSHWSWKELGDADVVHLYLTPDLLRHTAIDLGKLDPDRIEIVNHLSVPDLQLEYLGLALRQELVTGGMGGRLFGESLATAIAVQLLQKYAATKAIISEFKGGLPKYKLRAVIDYINAHLEQNLSLEELTTIVQMSPHHFSRLFKQSTGVSPHQYVIRCRVERAKQLLLKGVSIAEVAAAVGFYDQSHFAHHFRRFMGIPPKALLKQ